RLTVAAVVESVHGESVRHQRVDEFSIAAAVVRISVDDPHVSLGPLGNVRFPEEPQVVLGAEEALIVADHEPGRLYRPLLALDSIFSFRSSPCFCPFCSASSGTAVSALSARRYAWAACAFFPVRRYASPRCSMISGSSGSSSAACSSASTARWYWPRRKYTQPKESRNEPLSGSSSRARFTNRSASSRSRLFSASE